MTANKAREALLRLTREIGLSDVHQMSTGMPR